MTEVSNSGMSENLQSNLNESIPGKVTGSGAEIPAVSGASEEPKWYRWRRDGTALMQYLLDSEVHTFAFSVSANAILTFLPYIVLLYTLSWSVFHSTMMGETVTEMVNYFMPSNQAFIVGVLTKSAAHQGIQFFSLFMILLACTGIFLPLEVALNQAWGVTKSRNYLANQVVAFGLAILMVILGMGAVILNTVARQLLTVVFFGNVDNIFFNGLKYLILAASTGVASILFFFAIYWLLPNRKVPWKPVFRTSIITGLVWLVSKYIFCELLLPHLHLKDLYGGFEVSVGLIFWSYTSGLILFAGAQFSVSKLGLEKGGE